MTETTRHIRITAEYKDGHASPLMIRATCHRRELGALVSVLGAGQLAFAHERRYTIEADPWHSENATPAAPFAESLDILDSIAANQPHAVTNDADHWAVPSFSEEDCYD